ncbi:unnamed protein product [Ectocarpus sp. CCAP 1310/34]|nr:unnamed protein product [Ectocarpus sp. CCAP 1310/34]
MARKRTEAQHRTTMRGAPRACNNVCLDDTTYPTWKIGSSGTV